MILQLDVLTSELVSSLLPSAICGIDFGEERILKEVLNNGTFENYGPLYLSIAGSVCVYVAERFRYQATVTILC